MDILNIVFLGNSILNYLISFSFFLAIYLTLKILRGYLLKIIERRKKEIGDQNLKKVLIDFIFSIKSSFYLYFSFYVAVLTLTIPVKLFDILSGILFIWVIFRVIGGAQMLLDYFLENKILTDSDPQTKVAGRNIGTILKALIWIFAFLLILANLGVEVTSLIAGMGIGGIAVAFAFQNILQDLFSSFAIYFDKPFTVGDFLIVGDEVGTVEKIGIKSTRMRALQGEEIVVSNRELTNQRIHNFKKLEKRRIAFNFGVLYSTSDEKMEKIPEIVGKIVKKEKLADFDRAHFIDFGDWSLNFEVVYFILSADFVDFRNTHQSILLSIKKEFTKEGIEMAFPTKTVHLSKN